MANELKPCPFCNNKPSLNHMGSGSYSVSCSSGHHINTEASKEKAIKAWNTRPGTNADEIEAIVKQAMQDEWEEICSDTGCHPLDIEHGRGRRLSFIPLHWASAVAASVRSQVEQLNTRPAAPVEGLEVVAYRYRHVDYVNWTYSESKYPRPDIHNEELVTFTQAGSIIAELQAKSKDYRQHSERLEKRIEAEEVTRSQAEAIIAARDARIADLENELSSFRSSFKEQTSLKADNASLTGRVKELGGDRDSWRRVAEKLAGEKQALETQLAAARMALQKIAGDTYDDSAEKLARAALEVRP